MARRSLYLVSRALVFALALTFLAGCEQVSRSAYRKLATYEPQQLLQLDIRSMRVALLHDERLQLLLPESGATFHSRFEGGARETHDFPPRLIAESASISGLPRAGKGLRWTVLSLREEDVALARPLGYVYFRNELRGLTTGNRKEPTQSKWVAMGLSAIESANFLATVSQVLPRTANSQFEPTYSGVPAEMELQVRCGFARSEPITRTSLEIWLLLDPKDGYFRLTKGSIVLPEASPLLSNGRDGHTLNVLEVAAKDPQDFRLAVEHDGRAQVDLQNSGLVLSLANDRGGTTELLRVSAVAVSSRAASTPGLPPARKSLEWTVLAVRSEDLGPFSRLLRAQLELMSIMKSLASGETATWDSMSKEDRASYLEQSKGVLEKVFPGKPDAIEKILDSGLSFDVHICFSTPPQVDKTSFALSIWTLVDPAEGFREAAGGYADLEKRKGCVRFL
jgi:hypothetical protein